MSKFRVNSQRCWLSTNEQNGNLQATFSICDFSTNLNGVKLNRDTIDSWMGSIVTQPLVGKLVPGSFSNGVDFAGHERKVSFSADEDGNLVRSVTFDTNAFGVFTSVSIGEVDGKECLLATAEIWDRYPRAVELIKDRAEKGVLRTSWEIDPIDATFNDDGTKTINTGVFSAVCLLGSKVQPAYPEASKLLEVAEEEYDDELLSAITEDMREIGMKKEKTNSQDHVSVSSSESAEHIQVSEQVEVENVVVSEETQDVQTESVESEVPSNDDTPCDVAESNETHQEDSSESSDSEIASLTSNDIRRKLYEQVEKKLGRYAWISHWFPNDNEIWVESEDRETELDYVLYSYSVDGDTVALGDGVPVKLSVSVHDINDTLAQKDAAIAAALNENATLKEQIASLETIKAEYDKMIEERQMAENEAKKIELKEYAAKSGMFSDGELKNGNVKKMIDNLDQAGINQMIADRYMKSLETSMKKLDTEVSTVSHNLNGEDDKSGPRQTALRTYIRM